MEKEAALDYFSICTKTKTKTKKQKIAGWGGVGG